METTLRDLLLQRGSWARHAAGDWAWLGWEGGSTPAGGTGVVPSRRPGGPASQWWQRRSRRPPVTPQTHPRTDGLDRRGSVVGGRTSGACRRERSARRMAGPDSPTANAAGAEVFQGDRRGAAAPLDSRNVKRCVCGSPEAQITAGDHVSQTGTARSAFPAVVPDLAGPYRKSGKTGVEWRDSRRRHLVVVADALQGFTCISFPIITPPPFDGDAMMANPFPLPPHGPGSLAGLDLRSLGK